MIFDVVELWALKVDCAYPNLRTEWNIISGYQHFVSGTKCRGQCIGVGASNISGGTDSLPEFLPIPADEFMGKTLPCWYIIFLYQVARDLYCK